MIIKSLWKELVFDIQTYKGDKQLYRQDVILQLYMSLVFLVILTPIMIVIDLLLLPLEICYYFFAKWIRK